MTMSDRLREGIAMGSTHRLLDPRSDWVFDTHDLGRQAGRMKETSAVAEAPADLGIEVIGVPASSPVRLELKLESVVEGVLVTGTAAAELQGECVRCLEPISEELEIDLLELFLYPDQEPDDTESSRLVDELLDLEPVVRDGMVLEMPFQPLCQAECQGLCPECGANLNANPDHQHEAPIDPRWSALGQLAERDQQD